jgi:cephalosporin hydroxylase
VKAMLSNQIKKTIYRFLRVPIRLKIALHYYSKNLGYIGKWIWQNNETSNFYYGLTELNRDQLAQIVSMVTERPYSEITGYFNELEHDQELLNHLQTSINESGYERGIEVKYGRRLGWYAFIRATKPKIVIETGVDHGVGACVITSALIRNEQDGSSGRYFGTEIRKEAGALLSGIYAKYGEIIYGDSICSLKDFDGKIDLFINDSDHSADYEYAEYEVIKPKLSESAIILGDNSHVTDKLSQFSRLNSRRYVFFSEKPDQHWYPGAGIGISFRK